MDVGYIYRTWFESTSILPTWGSLSLSPFFFVSPRRGCLFFRQVTISGAAKVATTKEEFQALKAAQAKSDIREKFANSGLGDVDPEASVD